MACLEPRTDCLFDAGNGGRVTPAVLTAMPFFQTSHEILKLLLSFANFAQKRFALSDKQAFVVGDHHRPLLAKHGFDCAECHQSREPFDGERCEFS